MEVAAKLLLLLCLRFFHKSYAAELDTISDSRFLTDDDTLVSDTGIFELGFFRLGSSENRYLGIRYKTIPVTTLVCVANRYQPLASTSSLVLKITERGILTRYNNMSMVWSLNTTMESRNATAKLRDTGNLVLMDQHEQVLWQSFDYPTEHWLPGMKIGSDYLRGIEWHLSSWESSQQPVVGEFTWGVEKDRYPDDKLKQGSVVKFRGGPWRNQRFKGVSSFSRNLNFTYHVIINENEVSLSYSYEKSSTLDRITLSSSGKLESWGWVEGAKDWQLGVSFPKDLYLCQETKRVEMGDWSDGCVRRTPLDYKNGTEKFIKYSNVKLPYIHDSWFNKRMNMQEGEAQCLENCTCMAYANPDTSLGGRGCLLWFGELIDIRVYPEGRQRW
ncbi:putative non-specific serine/threonine protein kinase [Helianthus annuus]|nr:putative non-specific serine/threonine protein kinase [Helianthus annuus]